MATAHLQAGWLNRTGSTLCTGGKYYYKEDGARDLKVGNNREPKKGSVRLLQKTLASVLISYKHFLTLTCLKEAGCLTQG